MPELITSHAWRPPTPSGRTVAGLAPNPADRPCAFAGCGRPRAEHDRSVSGKWDAVTDWSRYQKCPACFAELGKPCMTLSGGVAFESYPVDVEAAEPHSTRKLRAEAARTGGSRG